MITVILYVLLRIVLDAIVANNNATVNPTPSVRSMIINLPSTVLGNSSASPSIVVYRHTAGGFGNNMMGLVTSYVFAMKTDAILYCRQTVWEIITSRTVFRI